MKGKPRPTHEEREKMKEKRIKKRENFERKNEGEYELIFPSKQNPLNDFIKYINAAKSTWEEFNTGTKAKKIMEAVLL